MIRAGAAVAVIVLALVAAAAGTVLSLALSLWAGVVLPAAIVLGVLALRLQVRADERAEAPTPPHTPGGRHRR